MAMAWALEDCSRPLRIRERQIEYGCLIKEQLKVEEEMRKKAESSWRPRESSWRELVLN